MLFIVFDDGILGSLDQKHHITVLAFLFLDSAHLILAAKSNHVFMIH